VGAVLKGIFEHLGGDSAVGVIEALRSDPKMDLELATSVAIGEALEKAQCALAPKGRLLIDDYSDWFSLWHRHLELARKSPAGPSALFYSDSMKNGN
jgi:hypothetical protein